MATSMTTRAMRTILIFDGALCLGMGGGLILLRGWLAGATGLPEALLLWAGLLLLPVAALISVAAQAGRGWLVRLVAVGNAGWVAASLALVLFGLAPMNGLGAALVLVQAFGVAALAAIEWVGAAAYGETARPAAA